MFSRPRFETIKTRVVEYHGSNGAYLTRAKQAEKSPESAFPIHTAPDFVADVEWVGQCVEHLCQRRKVAEPEGFKTVRGRVGEVFRLNDALIADHKFVPVKAQFYHDAKALVEWLDKLTPPVPDEEPVGV